jgi:CxxC-x17-CxxC domain-containing protein
MIDKNLPTREVKSQPVPKVIVVSKPALSSVPRKKAADIPVKKEEIAAAPAPREMYEAICSTCEQKIQVPFKPDPKRPTFCKECLKDYQRMVARSRSENNPPPSVARPVRNNYPVAQDDQRSSRETEPVTFVASEKPLSLSQVTSMAPKKFKPIRKKPMVDLAEVRRLINDK